MNRWYQFSLRGFLIVLAACAAWLAFKVNHARQQKAVADRIVELGGEVKYLHELDLNSSYYSVKDDDLGPAWLRQLIGDDYFVTIAYASCGPEMTDDDVRALARLKSYRWLSFYDSQVSDDALKYLKGMRGLQWLGLDGSQVTDAGLKHLRGLTQLRNLTLAKRPITDEGVGDIVACLPNLEMLHLGGTEVTDRGLGMLVALPRLRRLDLWGTDITNAGCDLLEGLPNLYDVSLENTHVSQEREAELKKMLRKREP